MLRVIIFLSFALFIVRVFEPDRITMSDDNVTQQLSSPRVRPTPPLNMSSTSTGGFSYGGVELTNGVTATTSTGEGKVIIQQYGAGGGTSYNCGAQ